MNLIVTQILRPIKLAFLIRPKNKASYLRIMRNLSLSLNSRSSISLKYGLISLFKSCKHANKLQTITLTTCGQITVRYGMK